MPPLHAPSELYEGPWPAEQSESAKSRNASFGDQPYAGHRGNVQTGATQHQSDAAGYLQSDTMDRDYSGFDEEIEVYDEYRTVPQSGAPSVGRNYDPFGLDVQHRQYHYDEHRSRPPMSAYHQPKNMRYGLPSIAPLSAGNDFNHHAHAPPLQSQDTFQNQQQSLSVQHKLPSDPSVDLGPTQGRKAFKTETKSTRRGMASINPAEDSEDDVPLMQRSKSSSPGNKWAFSHITADTPYPTLNPPVRPTTNIAQVTKVESEDDENNGNETQQEEEEPAKISWKLPEYEALSFTDPDDYPYAKVSIPGIVRHEISLNADRPRLELKLLQSVFLPSHERTYTPSSRDPEPKHSLLNFHTIANIFICAFDTLNEHSHLSPKDADPDEVFFAAIDGWRVGLAMGRKGYQAVRGIQEFCDVGLEVLFWIKENGFVEERKRRERSDKGIKRGPRGPYKKRKKDGDSGGGEEEKQKRDRSQPPKVNHLQPKPKGKQDGLKKVKSGRVEEK